MPAGFRRRTSVAAPVATVLLMLAGCQSRGSEVVFSNSPAPASPAPTSAAPSIVQSSPTPPAVPTKELPTEGPSSATCVNGWVRPEEGSRDFTDPIGIIRRTAPFKGPAVVVDMRMFTGPESPPSDKGYLSEVRRWYIKMYASDDLSYQGRFLVEQRQFGRGVAAVAPYDTSGFRSPDWSGFQWDAGDREPRSYQGLPGEWPGIQYDFVNGGGGIEVPGLPDEVRGCLDGT